MRSASDAALGGEKMKKLVLVRLAKLIDLASNVRIY